MAPLPWQFILSSPSCHRVRDSDIPSRICLQSFSAQFAFEFGACVFFHVVAIEIVAVVFCSFFLHYIYACTDSIVLNCCLCIFVCISICLFFSTVMGGTLLSYVLSCLLSFFLACFLACFLSFFLLSVPVPSFWALSGTFSCLGHWSSLASAAAPSGQGGKRREGGCDHGALARSACLFACFFLGELCGVLHTFWAMVWHL